MKNLYSILLVGMFTSLFAFPIIDCQASKTKKHHVEEKLPACGFPFCYLSRYSKPKTSPEFDDLLRALQSCADPIAHATSGEIPWEALEYELVEPTPEEAHAAFLKQIDDEIESATHQKSTKG